MYQWSPNVNIAVTGNTEYEQPYNKCKGYNFLDVSAQIFYLIFMI